MSGKPLHWLGSSRTDIRAFPRDARRIAGVELRRVQQGLDPLDWKHMTSWAGRPGDSGSYGIGTSGCVCRQVRRGHLRAARVRETREGDARAGCGARAATIPGFLAAASSRRSLGRIRLTMKLKVTPSTGNVFRDLGFRREEAEHLLVRADLMIQVQRLIASRRLKQRDAADILRVSPPRVSDLLRGRIDLFSTDALIDMLARLGARVRLTVKAGRRSLKVA